MASVKEETEESKNQEEENDLVEGGKTNDAVEQDVKVEAEEDGVKEQNREKEGGIEKVEENVKEKGNVKEEEGRAEEEDDEGRGKVKKGSKKVKRGGDKVELASPRTPGIERPSRERKTVERFTVNATARGTPVTKPMSIEKGRGSLLKDIPNVAFKLSKRKGDENLQLLHTILFGKKAKVLTVKKRISLFSGFVWVEDEEKQRAKVKEKLDKCVKEKLLDFCDVLNIPVNKATIKKEELSVKLLEFLESPHATTDTLLADKDKNKKRKIKESASKTSNSADVAARSSRKKPKLDSGSGKKRKHSAKEEVNARSESSQTEDDQDDDSTAVGVKSDPEEIDSEDDTEEGQDEPESSKAIDNCSSKKSAKKDAGNKTGEKTRSVSKGTSAKASSTPDILTKKPSSSKSKKGVAEFESGSKRKMPLPSNKKQQFEKSDGTTPAKDKSSRKKNSTKSSTKDVEKDQGKGKSRKSAKKEPSREELHAAVEDILKEVDFNTATLSDILKLLGKHFGIDLIHRKLEVKDIITEVINNMSDDEDEEATESGDGDSGKDDEDDEA
ncbi:DEK domain-containing chromatin-associated protein 1-like isoform X2 [Primulina huaijiensis]|uniref:DEK domain-containing chromatin-associated protein 1-like isoform X2 n=1 Tax=Primulina huaijiensis TaxID=1492673 RepID=UPI003CC75319